MGTQNKTCLVEGVQFFEIGDAGAVLVADVLHVTGFIRESAPNAGRNPRPSSELEAELPMLSSEDSKCH